MVYRGREHVWRTGRCALSWRRAVGAVCIGVLMVHSHAGAQAIPDPATELRRQDERTQVLRQREEKAIDIKSASPASNTTRIPLLSYRALPIVASGPSVLCHCSPTPLTPQDRTATGGRYAVRGFDGKSSLSMSL